MNGDMRRHDSSRRTMSMLTELIDNPLDPGYAEAAERRGGATSQRRSMVLIVVGLLVLGFVLATAYREAERREPATAQARERLLDDVRDQRDTSDQLAAQVEKLDAEVRRERDDALGRTSEGTALGEQVRALERQIGLVAVHGPGMTVTMADSEATTEVDPVTGKEETTPADENGRVLDRDLQRVVNALWASGAEAIAINGQRLSPTSAIRTAGGAILVDLYPLTSPYEIEAIGSETELLTAFTETATASTFRTYAQLYGMTFEPAAASELKLPAGAPIVPREAGPAK